MRNKAALVIQRKFRNGDAYKFWFIKREEEKEEELKKKQLESHSKNRREAHFLSMDEITDLEKKMEQVAGDAKDLQNKPILRQKKNFVKQNSMKPIKKERDIIIDKDQDEKNEIITQLLETKKNTSKTITLL